MDGHRSVPKRNGGSIASDDVARMAAVCVQCGLCNASCPTYLLEADERDGPRGRIRLIASMFAREGAPNDTERHHIGGCLSCMACVTACPTGVDYGHLIGHAKVHIRQTSRATLRERLLNWFTARVLPYPQRLRWVVRTAPAVARMGRSLKWGRLREFAKLSAAAPIARGRRGAFTGAGTAETKRDRRGRVILLAGCAQQVLRPSINDATIRLLARSGIDVEVAAGAGCCGAAAGDAGDMDGARAFARLNVDAWEKALGRTPADAIITNSAGCGSRVKDYGHLLRDDPVYAERAQSIAGLAQDVAEFLATHGLGAPRRWSSLKVACQSPCRLANDQGIIHQPRDLVYDAGFTVIDLPEAHLCCGASAGHAFREIEVAGQLRERKADLIRASRPDVVATGSLTCLKHLEPAIGVPIVHTIELLDWAYGGPVPIGLEAHSDEVVDVPGPPPINVEDYIRA